MCVSYEYVGQRPGERAKMRDPPMYSQRHKLRSKKKETLANKAWQVSLISACLTGVVMTMVGKSWVVLVSSVATVITQESSPH